MLRKTIFWSHLASGVITGLVVLMMSVTGVFLTYQQQLFAWADRSFYRNDVVAAESPAPVDAIIAAAANAELKATSLKFSRDPYAPVLASGGRGSGSLYVDAYTAEVLGPPSPGVRQLFSTVTRWHRWFNATGEARASARLVTGISNLAFLFLILSGMYLWLPRIFRWPQIRMRLFFSTKNKSSRARDFNWHHVFGIWSAIPLIVVVATASVFSFRWASDLVYVLAGDEPPARSGAAVAMAGPSTNEASRGPATSMNDLLSSAKAYISDWDTITLYVPDTGDSEVSFRLDTGSGRQPQYQDTLILSKATGAVTSFEAFADRSPGRQARSWVRFLHTGEAFGFAGQTVAGLVSLTSIFMVWTGFALAWRRLVHPILRRKSPRNPQDVAIVKS